MKGFLRHNGGLILVIALLLGLIIGVVSHTLGGIADPLSNVAGILATPFRSGINAVVNWAEGIYNDNFQIENMKEELAELRKENAALKAKAREGEAASRENDRFRNLLGLQEKHQGIDLESASVTARTASNWNSTLTISKGSADGIRPGSCVVDEYWNLVGVINEVGVNWSTLITVVDVDLEMGGRIARTDESAILEGDFDLMSRGKLKLTYLPEGSRLLAGEEVLTSGLVSGAEAIYPSGLLVGYVEELHADDSGMNEYAVLRPAAQLSELKQIFVVMDFEIVE